MIPYRQNPISPSGAKALGKALVEELFKGPDTQKCYDYINDGAALDTEPGNGYSLAQVCLAQDYRDRIFGAIAEAGGIKDYQINGLLHDAARYNRVNAVNWLLDHGAEIEHTEKDSLSWTPLIDAVMRRSSDAVALLIARGADIEHVGHGGKTPVMYAADGSDPGAVETLQCLLDAGADLDRVDAHGNNALANAGRNDVMAGLITAHIEGRAAREKAAFDQRADFIRKAGDVRLDHPVTPLAPARPGGKKKGLTP